MQNATTLSAVLSIHAFGVRLSIKARPGQNRHRAARIVDIGNEKSALELTIAAPPEDGKANAALIKLIAVQLGIPQRDITLASGSTGRIKQMDIQGNPDDLIAKLQAWLA